MLAELEIKLGNTYDKELDINSTNAVQNKAVTEAIHNIGEVIESTTISAKSYVDNEINTLDRKKQDVIDDLNEIRNKANTALQEHQDISHLATKTSVSAELNEKVDKVSGKGLSTNDFTNNFKTKLEGLSNYDDSEVKNLITSETNRAKSVEQDLTNAITTINGTGTGSMKKTVADEIAKVIDSAPAAFDTLKEIADYINEDQEAAAVIANDLVEHSNSIEENKNEIVAISKNVTELSDEKADKNGKYADLTAGDLYGHGESVEAEFSFRASGGKSIKDGTAYVKEIQGNSVVWNQKINNVYNINGVGGWFIRQGEGNANFDNNIVTINLVSGVSTIPQLAQNVGFISNHKYLITFEYNIVLTESSKNMYLILRQSNDKYGNSESPITDRAIGINEKSGHKDIFFTAVADKPMFLIKAYEYTNDIGESVSIIKPKVIDLTKMFGAGNEPTTIEDFYRLLPANIDINEYNEGEVIPFNADGIKSVGDNAWDEEWENGTIVDNTGELVNSENTIRSKNYIKVIGGQEYRFAYFGSAVTWGRLFYYDSDKALLYSDARGVNKNFTPPSNCAYIKFRMGDNYGTIYNHDITISLYHSGWKAEVDNTYKPYWADTLMFDARIKEAFPNGMYRAGSAYDIVRYNAETTQMEGVKMIGEVNARELKWTYNAVSDKYPYGFFYAAPTDKVKGEKNLLCDKYITPKTAGWSVDSVIFGNAANNLIYVVDSAYTDAASFTAMLQEKQVKLYYELAEPIVIPLGEFDLAYKVADFGTEEIVSAEPSAAFKGRTIYQFNAVDQIRENHNEIEKIKAALAKAGITI